MSVLMSCAAGNGQTGLQCSIELKPTIYEDQTCQMNVQKTCMATKWAGVRRSIVNTLVGELEQRTNLFKARLQ